MSPSYRMLIDGELVASASTFPVLNPATEAVVAECPCADEARVNAAVQAAKRAFPAWAATPMEERRAALRFVKEKLAPRKDEIVQLVVAEQGKPLMMAAFEFEMCMGNLQQNADIEVPIDVYQDDEQWRVECRRKPIGVVAAIPPWNYPLFTALQKWAAAIVLGNTVVLKPSPFTPLSMLLIGEILADVFPPGVFNVVSGPDDGALNIGAYLSAHRDVRKVSFTGSTATGKKIFECAARDVKRITLEMGGNDAAIVREDVDVEVVAPKVFFGAMANSGQICCAIKRVYVHEKVYDAFVNEITKVATRADAIMGDGMGEGVMYGPINNKAQLDKVSALVEDAKAHGAIIRCGGFARPGAGYFYPPTIVTDIREGVKLVDEEQFGPVLPIMPYASDDEAVARANDSTFGLGGSVWSADVAKANELVARLQCGTGWVNDHLSVTGGPFGGSKESSVGYELGKSDVDAFTELQTVRLAK